MKKIILFTFGICALIFKSYGQCGTAPVAITATPNTGPICGSQSVTLTQTGGVLPAGGNYFWYTGACGGAGSTLAGTGVSITKFQSATTTYYVRIEAPCGNTACVSVTITAATAAPLSVITAGGPTTFCAPGSVTLSANTGPGLFYQWRSNLGAIPGATNFT
jgi:hypothetical protein